MKKTIYFFAVIGLLSACVCKPISKPKNLKAIDFENWNDVETVHYNCVKLCSEPDDMEGRIVKVSGWCYCDDDNDRLYLINTNNPNKPKNNCYHPVDAIIIVKIHESDTTDYFAKVVYVEGEIYLPCLYTMDCSYTAVEILADTVYVE